MNKPVRDETKLVIYDEVSPWPFQDNWQQMVHDFNIKFGRTVNTTPTIPTTDDSMLCMRLVREEVCELFDAMGDKDLPEIADAIVDSIYVLLYTAEVHGINVNPIMRLVHEANMKKEGGGTREDGKILKPAGWTPPDVQGEIDRQIKAQPQDHNTSQGRQE